MLDCLEVDADGDGTTPSEGDCDDTNPNIYSGAEELCDGRDGDCDGLVPDEERDLDGDGQSACQGDCDDANDSVYRGAEELCDGLDTACDGSVPADEVDEDGDGQRICGGDCDDEDATSGAGLRGGCATGSTNDCDL